MLNERIDMFPPALWMRVAEQVERIQNLPFIAGRQGREQRSHCRFVKVPKLQSLRLDRLLLERLPERLHVPMLDCHNHRNPCNDQKTRDQTQCRNRERQNCSEQKKEQGACSASCAIHEHVNESFYGIPNLRRNGKIKQFHS